MLPIQNNQQSSLSYPPGYGPDPVFAYPPGQPIPISQPPMNPYLSQKAALQDAVDGIYQATYGQSGMSQRAPTEQERSAMMYLEAAQKALSAAADELPTLAPAIQQAGQVLSMGIQNLLMSGQGLPIAQPPSAARPPIEEGLAVGEAGPENIPLPGLV